MGAVGDASGALHERELRGAGARLRRLRALLAGVAALLVVTVAVGISAFIERDRAAGLKADQPLMGSQLRESILNHLYGR